MSIATTTEPESAAEPSGQSHECENQERGLYVYCIIDCDRPESFGPIGVGDDHPEVFVIEHEGVGAVVSCASCTKYDVSRGNVLAHQQVMEAVMGQGHAVLPVRFNTVAKDKDSESADSRIVQRVLKERLDEFSWLLSAMSTRVELGIKALWTDTKAVFSSIVDADEQIMSLRKKLLAASQAPAGRRPRNFMAARMKLGEMVKNALEARKLREEKELIACLAPVTVDLRKNKTFGDAMFANLAILVDKDRQDEVASRLSAFEAGQSGQTRIRCIGPLPPSNFIELVITWDD